MASPIELVPLQEHGNSALRQVASSIHRRVSHPDNTELLGIRNLAGTIVSHSGSAEASFEALTKARVASAQTLAAFVIYDAHESIGMARIMPELPLRKQRIPLSIPAKFTRNLLLSSVPTHKGPNVSSWIDVHTPGYTGKLTEVYAELFDSHAAGSWTIEPAGLNNRTSHEVLVSAEYQPQGEGLYDDYEAGRTPLVRSILYSAVS